MLEDENELADSGAGSGDDMGRTQQMSDPPLQEDEPKKEKKPGDWVTVEMPKVSKAAATKPPDVTPVPSVSGTVEPASPPPSAGGSVDRTMLETPGASDASTPPPPPIMAPSASSMPPASERPAAAPMQSPPPQGGVGGMLSNIGIKDPQTQKIALAGGAAVFLLCCACPCVLYIGNLALSMLGQ
jgi:hypothetical protein